MYTQSYSRTTLCSRRVKRTKTFARESQSIQGRSLAPTETITETMIFTETTNKRCCIEESALPAVASAAEYADKVNKPKGEAWVGRVFHKLFPGYGRLQGEIVEYRIADDLYAVHYDDGVAEDLNEREVRALLPRPHKPARVSADTTKRHEHDTRSPEEEKERDRQWIGFDQGDACVRKRRALRCDVALRNVHKRSRVGA